jgi:pimeloyl-ACP methyl ester carboxylesterase
VTDGPTFVLVHGGSHASWCWAEWNLDRLCLEAQRVSGDRIPRADLPDGLPRTYIRFLQDRSVPPDRVPGMIANLGGAELVDIDAGHNGMITRPAEVAAALNRVAVTTAR